MTEKLENKVAIITGGNSGIGEATAHLFATHGATVCLLARRQVEGMKVQASIEANGGTAQFFPCDVSQSDQVDAAVDQVVSRFGKIDILFNNAGVGDSGNFPSETDEGWEKVLSVNLSGTFYMCRSVWPFMIKNGGGCIINMSSVAAERGFSRNMYKLTEIAPSASYYAAKAGVDAFTRYTASMGGQHNIRVNGVRPGQIISPMTNRGDGTHLFAELFDMIQILEGPGYPEDVANAVLFLASPDARFITGEILNVDGGIPGKL